MRIAAIAVGRRHRKDFGDLTSLPSSIAELGFLQPVAVTAGGKLVAGARRLEAVCRLGRHEVPVHVVAGLDDAVQALRAEGDENAPLG